MSVTVDQDRKSMNSLAGELQSVSALEDKCISAVLLKFFAVFVTAVGVYVGTSKDNDHYFSSFFLCIGCMCVSAFVFVPPAVEFVLSLLLLSVPHKEEHQQTLESRNFLSIKVCWIQFPQQCI